MHSASVIDYVCISEELFNLEVDMQVGDVTESYHFPLEAVIQILIDPSLKQTPISSGSAKLIRYRWSKDKEISLVKNINRVESDLYLAGIEHMLEINKIEEAATILQKWLYFISREMEIKVIKKKAN